MAAQRTEQWEIRAARRVEQWEISQDLLLEAQQKAVRTMTDLLDSDDEAVRLRAAKELLSQCSSFKNFV